MRAKGQFVRRTAVLLVAVFLAASGSLAGQSTAPDKDQKNDAASFKEFTGRVQEYAKLHRAVESNLPALKSKEELPELIAAHQQALARKLREARPHAKLGDIFTHESREAFRHAVRSVFQGPQAAKAKATIKEKEPLKVVHLKVNQVYPETLAYTTVPPRDRKSVV